MVWDVRVFIFCQLPDADSVTGACSKQGVYNSLQTVTHRTLTLTTSIGQAVLEKTQPKAEFINQNKQVISPNIKVAPTQGNNYCKKHTRLVGEETQLRSCVNVKVVVQGTLSLTSQMVSMDIKQHCNTE